MERDKRTSQDGRPSGQPEGRDFLRRDFLKVAGSGAAGGALLASGIGGTLAGDAEAAPAKAGLAGSSRGRRRGGGSGAGLPRIEYVMPTLTFENSAQQTALGAVYEAALTNVVGINTAYGDPDTYDLSNLITYPPGNIAIAGQGYPLPQRWTRDSSVNTWNAISLLSPLVGANTLWGVVDSQSGGGLIVQQNDGEWWDQIVWIVSAWNHYLITGDQDFLSNAYGTAVNTMNARRSQNFNSTLGLFQGPGFMNDGISAYPSPPYETGIDNSSVLSYPYVDVMMCLSTNCLYYGAYQAMLGMARELGKGSDASSYKTAGSALKTAINTNFWRSDAGLYGYLIHGAGDPLAGQLDTHQEGGGLALAILLGVASPQQTQLVLQNTHWQPYGVVNVWPNFSWFTNGEWGRQASLWPMVHSMFGHAAALGGRVDLFERAVSDLAGIVTTSQTHFYEIYNSVTGVPDGGWQTGGNGQITQWTSEPDQTWSATGYLRMIYRGLFGLTFTPEGLQFAPSLPASWGTVSLTGISYRGMLLDITLTGAGNRVAAAWVDGRRSLPLIPADESGYHQIQIALAS
jgi:hypothetical protein